MAAFSCFAGAKVIHSHAGMGCMTFCTLAVEILMPADFSVLRTPEILETFEIRTFFCEKWLLSHVSRAPKSSIPMQAWDV